MRRVLSTLAAVAALTVGTAAPALAASAAPTPLVGPECQPNIVAAVLVSLQTHNISLPPGTQLQYIEPVYGPSGALTGFRYCTVTTPS